MITSEGKMLGIAGVAIVIIVLSSSFAYAYSGEDGWFVDEIDQCGYHTDHSKTAMTMDENGQIHVAYRSIRLYPDTGGYGYVIMHATGYGSNWVTTIISGCGEQLQDIAIRITDDGSVHILWCNEAVLGYAVNAGQGWGTETVNIENGCSARIALDRNGVAHALCVLEDYVPQWVPDVGTIPYYAYELQEWTCTSGAWNMTRIHANPEGQQWTSVCTVASETGEDIRGIVSLTSNGTGSTAPMRVRITDSGLEYNETSGLTGIPGNAHSRIDSQGRMHVILMASGDPFAIVYIMDDDITEATTVHLIYVDNYNLLYIYFYDVASIFLDSNDEPQVAYITCEMQVMLAHMVEGEWETEAVGGRDMPKAFCGITMIEDDSEVSHIMFYALSSPNYTGLIHMTSDSTEVLKSALVDASLFTGVGTMILGPVAFVIYHVRTKRREQRQNAEAVGLFDLPRWLGRKKL
ncbi:MAG: hypothetical protein E4H25_05580 [Methanomassiliicoccus sp.]|nr:MAG: hypothetical protein E4H25_05580 [Methanomassiliicoccus sp.]